MVDFGQQAGFERGEMGLEECLGCSGCVSMHVNEGFEMSLIRGKHPVDWTLFIHPTVVFVERL